LNRSENFEVGNKNYEKEIKALKIEKIIFENKISNLRTNLYEIRMIYECEKMKKNVSDKNSRISVSVNPGDIIKDLNIDNPKPLNTRECYGNGKYIGINT
jgi:hypothetical protein